VFGGIIYPAYPELVDGIGHGCCKIGGCTNWFKAEEVSG